MWFLSIFLRQLDLLQSDVLSLAPAVHSGLMTFVLFCKDSTSLPFILLLYYRRQPLARNCEICCEEIAKLCDRPDFNLTGPLKLSQALMSFGVDRFDTERPCRGVGSL